MVRRLRSGADTSSEMETQGRRSSSRGAADACSPSTPSSRASVRILPKEGLSMATYVEAALRRQIANNAAGRFLLQPSTSRSNRRSCSRCHFDRSPIASVL